MDKALETPLLPADHDGRPDVAPSPCPYAVLERLQTLLAVARAEFGADATVPTLRVFLDIALNGETHMTAIAERLAMGKSSASRSVSMLTEVTWLRKPGPGLVAAVEDLRERRIRRLSLTPRGEGVARRLARAIGS